MDLAPELALAKLRCAPFHASTGADPVGSAGAYDAFLVVEVPLPWERDISAHEPFASLMATAPSVTGDDGRRWRPMGVVPEDRGDGRVRVTAFELPEGRRRAFDRREWLVEPDGVVELCRGLLAAAPGRARVPERAEEVEVPEGVVDLLICTHGRRDACCGSQGAAVHQELGGLLGGDPTVRLRRCSHTGGHRFAATAVSFPDGYAWAHLDADVALRVARRSVPPHELAAHCRGSSLFDGGPAQAADRVGLAQVGWDWVEAERTAVVVAHERDTLATTVRVRGEVPDGRCWAWDVRVEVERWVPTPTCGAVEAPEFTVEPVWSVTGIDALPDAGVGQ